MIGIDATARDHDGITLVTAIVEGGPVPTRITLSNRLDGPVWPPRRMGEPVAGWNDEGYEGVVLAGERVALGYACPAPPIERPLTVVATERATDESASDSDSISDFDSASAVLRGLGSPAPPRDAVPLPGVEDDGPEFGEDGSASGQPSGEMLETLEPSTSGPIQNGDATAAIDSGQQEWPDGDLSPEPTRGLPESLAAWFDEVERRIERAETLDDVTDVVSATEAIRACGSLSAVATLERRRATDTERLREIASRANALAYRAESAAIPFDVLCRLA